MDLKKMVQVSYTYKVSRNFDKEFNRALFKEDLLKIITKKKKVEPDRARSYQAAMLD